MKISPVSRSRVSHINSPTYSGGSKPVEKTDSVTKMENYSKSASFEFGKEHFYDKLDNYRKKEKNQDFQKEDNNPKDNTYTFSKEEKEMIDTIRNILTNFNNKIDIIKSTDIARNQNNLDKVKTTYKTHSRALATMGIYVDKFFHFYVKDEQFASSILKNPVNLTHLTDPANGILKKLTLALTI